MVWVCVLLHNTCLQLTLPHFFTSGFGLQFQHHLVSATQMFNSFLPPSDAINAEALLLTPVTQISLSSKLDDYLFKVLLDTSFIADKARLLSVSSPHAGSWLSVTPSEGLGYGRVMGGVIGGMMIMFITTMISWNFGCRAYCTMSPSLAQSFSSDPYCS